MNYPKLHVHDGRLISLDYTLTILEIIEYDDTWDRDEDTQSERRFELHDKHDDFYWVSEHYKPESCRRTSEAYNTVSHGHVLCCGSEVIVKLESEQQGKDIIKRLALYIADNKHPVLFFNTDLTISTLPKKIESERS